MRPAPIITAEAISLAAVLLSSMLMPSGLPLGLYAVVAQLLATYLVHCPAHYLVGRAVGIRFRRVGFGRTTLARALPKSVSSFAKLFPILTLTVAKDSVIGVSKKNVALMYEAGTISSVSIAFAVAIVATLEESLMYASLAWAVALAYLAFDWVFSPKSGDLARARAALA